MHRKAERKRKVIEIITNKKTHLGREIRMRHKVSVCVCGEFESHIEYRKHFKNLQTKECVKKITKSLCTCVFTSRMWICFAKELKTTNLVGISPLITNSNR